MTETDISRVLIEGDYATIMGVKYKRVEAPKSIRAEEIWKAFKGELIDNGLKDSEDVRQGLSTAIRIVADRLCTDVGEMECPIEVVRKIADELEELK